MRLEIRVRPMGLDWEVDEGPATTRHSTRAAALRQARDRALLLWLEDRRCCAVKELRSDGWVTDVFYGLEGLYA